MSIRASPAPRPPTGKGSNGRSPSSARAVVAEFNRDRLRFPVRIGKGPRKGELAWQPLTHWRVLRTLHNPRYAGAFVYGQRREARNPATGKMTTINVPREQWFAFFP